MKIYEDNTKKNLILAGAGLLVITISNLIGGIIGGGLDIIGLILLFVGLLNLAASFFSHLFKSKRK